MGAGAGGTRAAAARLVEFVRGLGPVGRALDLGCGDGRLTAELDARELTAADVSGVALERARRGCRARAVELEPDRRCRSRRRLRAGAARETVEHVRDLQLFLSELRRVLAPGGELALTTPATPPLAPPGDPFSPHLRRFTARSLRRALDDLGFEVDALRRRRRTLLARARR